NTVESILVSDAGVNTKGVGKPVIRLGAVSVRLHAAAGMAEIVAVTDGRREREPSLGNFHANRQTPQSVIGVGLKKEIARRASEASVVPAVSKTARQEWLNIAAYGVGRCEKRRGPVHDIRAHMRRAVEPGIMVIAA